MSERKLTVYSGGGSYRDPFPQIILQGQWLRSLGFSAGDKINVICDRNRIIIEKFTKEDKKDE